MPQIDLQQFKNVLSDFIKLSKEVVCGKCENTTKLVGETRKNGGWFCPFCYEYYSYNQHPEIEVEVPFTKLTTQLEVQTSEKQSSVLMGDPVTVDFPMDLSTGFLVPSYSSGYRIKRKRNVLLGQAIDFSRFGRIKSGMVWQFDLGYNDRTVGEYEVLASFAETQGNHLPFNYTDPFRGSSHICYFESDVSELEPVSFDGGSFSVMIGE